jgi:hypothetical protein
VATEEWYKATPGAPTRSTHLVDDKGFSRKLKGWHMKAGGMNQTGAVRPRLTQSVEESNIRRI